MAAGGVQAGVEVAGPVRERYEEILTPAALGFLADLQRRFGPRREQLLRRRQERYAEIAAGRDPDFLPHTAHIRADDSWTVATAPPDLLDRRCEITGPTDRKMLVNALNSGARVFMADFEDSNTPTWDNLVQGQLNLLDAVERRIDFTSAEGKDYRLAERTATLVVRPRGWHLEEKHLLVDGAPMAGALFDFGLYLFHAGRRQLGRGSGPYLYLPKLESHLEARLWNDVFLHAQEALDIPRGTIRATCLIETILAAFEMDEILFELREHSAGLNAGRWDYIFSVIKNFRARGADFLLPDRAQVTMTAPFMRAYTELLVSTCHRRGAHAIGGMAAFIPSRRDPEVTERALAQVRADKEREAGDGFDGTWVAHPDLVPVATEVFDAVLGERPNQIDRRRDDVRVTAVGLLDVRSTRGAISEAGLRNNVSVALQYLASWLAGTGAVAVNNLMEDVATAEISRSQVWQWVHNGARLADGSTVTRELVRAVTDEELGALREARGDRFDVERFAAARDVFDQVALSDDFADFLTLSAYDRLDQHEQLHQGNAR